MAELPEARAAEMVWLYIPPVLIALGTFGNLMTGLVLRRLRIRRSAMPVFLGAIAVSDTLSLYTGLFRRWLMHAFLIDLKTLGGGWCKVMTWLLYSSLMLSAWLLMLMTVERCLSVWVPHRVSLLCTKHAAILIVVVAVMATLLVNCHFLFYLGLVTEEEDGASSNSSNNGRYYSFPGAVDGYVTTETTPFAIVTSQTTLPSLTSRTDSRNITLRRIFRSMTTSYAEDLGREVSLKRDSVLETATSQAYFKTITNEFNTISFKLTQNLTSHTDSVTANLDSLTSVYVTHNVTSAVRLSGTDDVIVMTCSMDHVGYRSFFDVEWPWLDLALSSLLPFAVLLTGNCLILTKVAMSFHQSRELSHAQYGDVRNLRKHMSSMTVILITLSIVFIVTTLPVCIFNIIEIYILKAVGDDPRTVAKMDLAWAVVNVLMYSNCALNFYLYCLPGRKFRREFLKCLHSCCCRRPSKADSDSRVTASSMCHNGVRPGRRRSRSGISLSSSPGQGHSPQRRGSPPNGVRQNRSTLETRLCAPYDHYHPKHRTLVYRT